MRQRWKLGHLGLSTYFSHSTSGYARCSTIIEASMPHFVAITPLRSRPIIGPQIHKAFNFQ